MIKHFKMPITVCILHGFTTLSCCVLQEEMHAEDFTYKERVLRVSLTEIRVFFNLKWSGAASRAWSFQ
jgi:hypothetical protein